ARMRLEKELLARNTWDHIAVQMHEHMQRALARKRARGQSRRAQRPSCLLGEKLTICPLSSGAIREISRSWRSSMSTHRSGNGKYILGGGVTGLAAGITAGLPVLEAAAQPGGICSSYYVRPGSETRLPEP